MFGLPHWHLHTLFSLLCCVKHEYLLPVTGTRNATDWLQISEENLSCGFCKQDTDTNSQLGHTAAASWVYLCAQTTPDTHMTESQLLIQHALSSAELLITCIYSHEHSDLCTFLQTRGGDGAVDKTCERPGFESTVRHQCVPEQDT